MFIFIQIKLLQVWQTALIALRALRRNKMRSMLTALGIIIGVASVVAMVAVGNGAQARITSQVSALGQNLLMVFAGSKKSGGVNSGLGSASAITLADAEAIQREVPDVAAVSPEVSVTAQAIANGRNWSTTVVGESQDYLKIRDWKLAAGSMFNDSDIRSAAKIAVIGSKTANELFGPLNPVGQSVRIGNIPFTIIGLLESKGAGMGGANQDDRILIPYTTAMKRITGDRYLRSVNVEIRSADRMEIAQQQITSLLRQRHRLTSDQSDDFNIFNQKEIADTVNSISKIITLLARFNRRHFARRRRHRHHEHHVGERHGTHPRNRHPHRRGRRTGRHPAAISHRGGDIEFAGRLDRRALRRRSFPLGRNVCRFQGRGFKWFNYFGIWCQFSHWHLLWLLSGAQSRRS